MKFSYKRPGFSLQVLDNRVEIKTSRFLILGKQESILFRNISSVEVPGMVRKLNIITNDGRKRSFNVGGKAHEARDAILAQL